MNMGFDRFSRAIAFLFHTAFGAKALLVDVTYDCNLSCRQCYFFGSKQAGFQDPYSEEEFLKKLAQIKKENNARMCTWIGGEPLLKKNLLEKARKLFFTNWIITNGTLPIPDWKDCIFWISIDGNKEKHDFIRGKGNYEKALKNARETKSKVLLHMTVSSQNLDAIEELVNDWRDIAEGVTFSFYTSPKRDEFSLSNSQKIAVLERLLELKKKEKGFILLSKGQIHWMMPENASKAIGKNCLLKKYAIAFTPSFKQKYPCMFEGYGNCANCGCSMAYFLHTALRHKDAEAALLAIKKFS